jgi:hypothetical protein
MRMSRGRTEPEGALSFLTDRQLLELILEKTFFIGDEMIVDQAKLQEAVVALQNISDIVDDMELHAVAARQQLANGNSAAATSELDALLTKVTTVQSHVASVSAADTAADTAAGITIDPAAPATPATPVSGDSQSTQNQQ